MKRKTLFQFFKFGLVGAVGFCVDAFFLYLGLFLLGLGPIAAAFFSFPFAVTTTWFGNRLFTFPESGRDRPAKQCAKFGALCAVGIVINRGTYSLLVSFSPFIYAYPVLGLLCGTLAALFFNFYVSKTFVFLKKSS